MDDWFFHRPQARGNPACEAKRKSVERVVDKIGRIPVLIAKHPEYKRYKLLSSSSDVRRKFVQFHSPVI